MRTRRLVSRVAATALAGGVIAATQLPAFASPRATPAVTITAKTAFKKVTGDVWVLYHSNSTLSTALFSGKVTGAATGEVAELFQRQFPYKSGWKQVGSPVTLAVSGTTATYSFERKPKLATQYKVELLASASSTTPLATSHSATVYLVARQALVRQKKCRRGAATCHWVIKVKVFVPSSALNTERAKRWLPYFAITHRDVAPKYLDLKAGHGSTTKSVKTSSNSYSYTVSYRFATPNNTFAWANQCAKDTESKDGLNLPGHHSCGLKKIKWKLPYLG